MNKSRYLIMMGDWQVSNQDGQCLEAMTGCNNSSVSLIDTIYWELFNCSTDADVESCFLIFLFCLQGQSDAVFILLVRHLLDILYFAQNVAQLFIPQTSIQLQ